LAFLPYEERIPFQYFYHGKYDAWLVHTTAGTKYVHQRKFDDNHYNNYNNGKDKSNNNTNNIYPVKLLQIMDRDKLQGDILIILNASISNYFATT
jgi:hypothetical protein